MGRGYYVCVGVDNLDSVIDVDIMHRSKATERDSGKVEATSQVSRTEDRLPSRTKAALDSTAGQCSTTDQRDDSNIFSCIVQGESHILRENLQRLLECSGLSDLPVTQSPLAWLPDPLRALTPCTSLLDASAKSPCDHSAKQPACYYARCFTDKPATEDDETDAVRHRTRAKKEPVVHTDHHEVVEVEVEWDDPSLRDVYPFIRQSYSTEQKALDKREADG